jgi:stage II sporulation protein D
VIRPRLAPALALALLAASCATVPVPAPAPTPAPPARPARPPEPPAHPGPLVLRSEPDIEVGLAWSRDTLVLAPAGRPAFVLRRERPGAAEATAVAGLLRVLRSGDGARAAWDGGVLELGPSDTLWVEGGAEAPRFGWDGRTWRGVAKVFVDARGALTLAARLPLETYLLGVVPGEIGALREELLEAGRAQAVAARSYTLYYRGRRGAEGFDLYGTVEDQVYGPIESERPLATRCVVSTHGRVALADGQPIRANYSSTCGGVTAEVWEAWPADALSYLVSHADGGGADHCAASPQYRWREVWTADAFVRTVERWAPEQRVALPPSGLGALLDVRVDARSRSGRVWRLVVSTTTGDVVVPAHALRRVLRRPGAAGAILRSNLFKVAVRRDPATRRAIEVVASGAGSGHGVGLCQTGALGMARAGRDADAILRHYYRGVRIERLY